MDPSCGDFDDAQCRNINCFDASADCIKGCGDYSPNCYQQPPRTQPIRPIGSIYKSNVPLETDTIYKRSYAGNYGDCKVKPIVPTSNLYTIKEPLEKCTIQNLSYVRFSPIARTRPIFPRENGIRFNNGPLYAISSQKHDFVPKGFCKRSPIMPSHGIFRELSSTDNCTVNRLSFMPFDVSQNPPPKPIIHGVAYQPPKAPFEKCTIQKLSYQPVGVQPKPHMPWAQIQRCSPPKYENLCTTYNLSYIPNCNTARVTPIVHVSNLKDFGTERNDGGTVYKLSYVNNGACGLRALPILPKSALRMPTGQLEKFTIQKLSYQGNCIARTPAFRPKESGLKSCGPMYFITTQRHDFMPKPMCKRPAIRQNPSIGRPTGEMEKCTVNKLSYMPVNVGQNGRPQAILPKAGIYRNEGPMEKCTTYKLSYLPVDIPPPQIIKSQTPVYSRPTMPMEKCTVQKLSYGPPGIFSGSKPCCCN